MVDWLMCWWETTVELEGEQKVLFGKDILNISWLCMCGGILPKGKHKSSVLLPKTEHIRFKKAHHLAWEHQNEKEHCLIDSQHTGALNKTVTELSRLVTVAFKFILSPICKTINRSEMELNVLTYMDLLDRRYYVPAGGRSRHCKILKISKVIWVQSYF